MQHNDDGSLKNKKPYLGANWQRGLYVQVYILSFLVVLSVSLLFCIPLRSIYFLNTLFENKSTFPLKPTDSVY